MNIRNFAGVSPLPKGETRDYWGLAVLVMALLAMCVALMLSRPGMNVWAWDQSPVSPVSPVLTQPSQTLTASPTVPAIIQTSASETPFPLGTQPLQSGSRGSTAMLVAGGIVLIGLVAGAMVLLMRGEPSDELVS